MNISILREKDNKYYENLLELFSGLIIGQVTKKGLINFIAQRTIKDLIYLAPAILLCKYYS